MGDAELNRRIAELKGITVEHMEYQPVVNLQSGWYIRGLPGANPAGGFWTEESAWAALPDFSGDPSAALALLAGVYWQASKIVSNEGDSIQIVVTGRIDATRAPQIDYGWHANALIVNGDEARAFAEAAARAWVQWKEAGE